MSDRHLRPERHDPRVIELYQAGASTNEVARALGLSQGMVARILDVAGVPRRSISAAYHNYLRRKRTASLLRCGEVPWQHISYDPGARGSGAAATEEEKASSGVRS